MSSSVVPAQTAMGPVRGVGEGSAVLTLMSWWGMPIGSIVTFGWSVKRAAIWGLAVLMRVKWR